MLASTIGRLEQIRSFNCIHAWSVVANKNMRENVFVILRWARFTGVMLFKRLTTRVDATHAFIWMRKQNIFCFQHRVWKLRRPSLKNKQLQFACLSTQMLTLSAYQCSHFLALITAEKTFGQDFSCSRKANAETETEITAKQCVTFYMIVDVC